MKNLNKNTENSETPNTTPGSQFIMKYSRYFFTIYTAF